MGCGCAGGKKATEQDPTILGDPVGPVVQVRATVAVLGAKAGETTWVKGSHVEKMIEAGWLQRL
jgi:hypothetical protein